MKTLTSLVYEFRDCCDGGPGLGLSIVQRAVKASEAVTVRSEPGLGNPSRLFPVQESL